MINSNYPGQIKFRTSCTNYLGVENEYITSGAAHLFHAYREQDMSSMDVSQKQVSQAGPEGEWEVGNLKAEKDLFCAFSASVNAGPIGSGHDQRSSMTI